MRSREDGAHADAGSLDLSGGDRLRRPLMRPRGLRSRRWWPRRPRSVGPSRILRFRCALIRRATASRPRSPPSASSARRCRALRDIASSRVACDGVRPRLDLAADAAPHLAPRFPLLRCRRGLPECRSRRVRVVIVSRKKRADTPPSDANRRRGGVSPSAIRP